MKIYVWARVTDLIGDSGLEEKIYFFFFYR